MLLKLNFKEQNGRGLCISEERKSVEHIHISIYVLDENIKVVNIKYLL